MAVESTEQDHVTQKPFIQQVVQFFDDTHTFVAIEDEEPSGDPWAEVGPYPLYLSGQGRWPYSVAAATTWFDGTCPNTLLQRPNLTHPTPIATVTEEGDVHVWQFDHGIEGESFLEPIGTVMAGTKIVGTSLEGPLLGLWAYQPDGTLKIQKDSDCVELQSPLLKAQTFSATLPASAGSHVDDGEWSADFTAENKYVRRLQ